jgi:hypothetical protein
MSRELMVVEQPDFLERPGLDASSALRFVYSCYGFRLPDEIPSAGQTLIVAAQTGQSEPQPVSRDDYFAHTLDPVRNKAAGGRKTRMNLRSFLRRDNMLVFVFDPAS